MKHAIVMFLIKQGVKYLNNHKDLIPGNVDNVVIGIIADYLGV
ncbi:HNH endonuclease [Mycobacterium phage Odin]|nr:HNH endonuclease [Mycobacterium phage Odin]